MKGQIFWKDGQWLPVQEARVALDDSWFSGGYGIYETLKVRQGKVYFPDLHEQRLLESARMILLNLSWEPGSLGPLCQELARKNDLSHTNIKIMILGEGHRDAYRSYAFCQDPPLLVSPREGHAPYPPGIRVISYPGERSVPQAKTLGLLVSLMARKTAMSQAAYEALLVNRRGMITEGTRSNFLVLQGRQILSPPREEILWGVTLQTLMEATEKVGYQWVFQDLPLSEYSKHPGAFLTSTSVNVQPIGWWGPEPTESDPELVSLHNIYQQYLREAFC